MRSSTGLALALVAATFAGPARAQSVVAVHPTKVEQTMSGFGAGIDGNTMLVRTLRKLSCRDRDDARRALVAGDTLCDPRYELRCEAPDHLVDARPKLVEDVHPRVAANRRTKIVECRRSGSRPIWTVSTVDSDRTQHSEQIRSVQPSLSGGVTRDENARNCVSSPAQKGAASRRVIIARVFEQWRVQILIKKGVGLFLDKHQLIRSG